MSRNAAQETASPEIAELSHEKTPPGQENPLSSEREKGDTKNPTRAIQESIQTTEDVETTAAAPSEAVYSTFSRKTKVWIVTMATISSFVSPMTATIYYPSIGAISRDLDTGIDLVNLTITSYMIVQAIAPTLYGDFGDMAGRRPALLVSFAIYLCANIGLALQRDYAALLVLRMLQGAGAGGTIPLSFAMVADVTMTSERGRYMGILDCGINVGPAIGPVLGGLLSQFLGWEAIFWFSAIVAVVFLVPFTLTVPETCRAVVGNGSIPAQSWNKPLLQAFQNSQPATDPPADHVKPRLSFPNPLRVITILFDKEMSLILIFNSVLYLAFIVLCATLSTLFKEIYGYSDLVLGLCFLPYGAGCCLASVGQGYILDWNYARTARRIGFVIDRRNGDDLLNFPIERARLEPVYPAIPLGIITLILYGWCLQMEVHVAVLLVLQFVIGICIVGAFGIMSTLIVDLNPTGPGRATAANNFVRCLLGAVGAAVIDYMLQAMGRGWTFTLIAAVIALLTPMVAAIVAYGPKWRKEKSTRALHGCGTSSSTSE